jgi:flagellar protein FlaG
MAQADNRSSMSFEIGPISPFQSTGAIRRTEHASRFSLDLARPAAATAPAQDSAELSLPAHPPTEVLDAIGAAAERAAELRAGNRELHFHKDEASGRVIVQVRDLEGNVIRTIPPSKAIDVMAGARI